ncbi:hypothetical protein A2U01_0057802, partial [Trifolium medium]|nr:hypothetical protein [Trifolium medium]
GGPTALIHARLSPY